MWRPSRREVLVAGGLLAACPAPQGPPDAGAPTIDAQAYDHATRTTLAPQAIAEAPSVFPRAVSSGGMRSDGVVLCTRALGVAEVVLRVWRDVGSATEVALVLERSLVVPQGGHLKETVSGLAPATWYHYGFFTSDGAGRSLVGSVRTAFPDDWAEPLTLGATSCASFHHAPFVALQVLAKQPMDAWLHLGDVSYNDGANGLEAFRAKWETALSDPGYRALMSAAGGYLVWDDHDFENNFDIEARGPNSSFVADGTRSFLESLPVETDEKGRVWRSYRWGKTAEIFVLDARMERKPSTRETPQAQYLSPEQMAWLTTGLRDSPCHFKVVMNSVPITNMPPPLWGAQADRWQGYPAAREQLLSFLETNDVKNVWFMGGDFHLGLVMKVEKSGPRSRYLEVCGGPAGNVTPLAFVLEPGQEANKKIAFPPEQFLYAGGGFSATTLTFDPKSDSVRVVFVDSMTQAVTYDQVLRQA